MSSVIGIDLPDVGCPPQAAVMHEERNAIVAVGEQEFRSPGVEIIHGTSRVKPGENNVLATKTPSYSKLKYCWVTLVKLHFPVTCFLQGQSGDGGIDACQPLKENG